MVLNLSDDGFQGMPQFGNVEKKKWIAAHTDKLLAVKWCGRRIVHMLTTVFTAAEKDSGKTHHKKREPIIKSHVLEYNQNMGAYGRYADQLR
ncbi:hypothetical protein JTB14_004521 [Gonioctena quinquepunctata]|nr:hypothetical protein JTB14_004521 [Gonioctena quinquepunctata]